MCLAAATALGHAAAVDRLAAATTQAHVGVHLFLCLLHYTRVSDARGTRETKDDEQGGTYRLLSNDSGVGGGELHGLLLLWHADFGHFACN